jgi:serine/threonine protein kinase
MRPRDEARLKASDVWRAAWRIDGPTNEGDVANAIGEGIIHRDLKPANISCGPTAR